jgi:resuscitation-promoting factor RpfA
MTVPQRDHELSRIYSEGAWPEPRRQIDEAILEASRRSARARHPVLHRWGPPLGLAATVVLGVSLALLVTDNQSLREASRLSDEAPRSAPQKKREAAAPASRADTARGDAEAKPGAPPPPHELFSSPMGPTEAKPAPAAKAAPPASHPTPPASQPVPPAALAKRPAAPPAAAKSPAPQPLVGRLAAPASDPQRAERIRRETEQLQENREARDSAPPASAPAQPQSPSSASVSDVRGLVAPAVARTPEAWLDDIRRLKTAGRNADAERELGEFRKRYPDFRVPEDLR